ncbi:CK1 family protein kinase [Reticulomyxa filosa]|uniref:Casein kinase I n=1 Tax=Reticulomyxa filosa TaxID=46433 RepID=X6MW21_RETFI|nr:CK1 family protein kinase [Reticulomyxa filosa]|eukprot:ETO18198.1 CK1 family protein kinase [Reticulomyxa filosa]
MGNSRNSKFAQDVNIPAIQVDNAEFQGYKCYPQQSCNLEPQVSKFNFLKTRSQHTPDPCELTQQTKQQKKCDNITVAPLKSGMSGSLPAKLEFLSPFFSLDKKMFLKCPIVLEQTTYSPNIKSQTSSQNPCTTNSSHLQDLKDRFQVEKKLGKGSFGVTYEAIDLMTKSKIALKRLKNYNEEPIQLEEQKKTKQQVEMKKDINNTRELQILTKLKKCDRVPKLLWHGFHKNYKVIAMELQSKNLCTLFENSGRKFSLKSCIHIAIETLQFKKYTSLKYFKHTYFLASKKKSCMEQLHACGVVHRDIKPQNFLIGIKNPSKVYIIDFGLSTWFVDHVQGKHIPYKDRCSPVGTGTTIKQLQQ